MKIKPIVISIISFIIVVCILESYYAYNIFSRICYDNAKNKDFKGSFSYKKPFMSDFHDVVFLNDRYYNKNSEKTIMVLGCSYAEGAGLLREKNFSAFLSDSLNYNVLNAGFGGHGIQSAYKFIKDDYKKEYKNYNINAFIYIYMKDHLRRIYERNSAYTGEIYPYYKLRNNKLIEIKPNFPYLYSSYFVENIFSKIEAEKYEIERQDYKMFNVLISELNKTTKDFYPNSKFIILVVPKKYTASEFAIDSMFPDWELKNLQNMGISVINAETLTNENLRDEKWYIEDKCHPSSEYWQLIMPQLSAIIKQQLKN